MMQGVVKLVTEPKSPIPLWGEKLTCDHKPSKDSYLIREACQYTAIPRSGSDDGFGGHSDKIIRGCSCRGHRFHDVAVALVCFLVIRNAVDRRLGYGAISTGGGDHCWGSDHGIGY